MMRYLATALTIGLTLPCVAQEVSSSAGLDGFVTLERLPIPDQPMLEQGRAVWGGTCQNCHGGNKLTGAPKITSTKAWKSRIEQGFEPLITHAIEGFIGPKFTEMPARGGNSDLTDEQITLAVVFMVWTSGGQKEAIDFLENYTKD
jgi:cytochrome c5